MKVLSYHISKLRKYRLIASLTTACVMLSVAAVVRSQSDMHGNAEMQGIQKLHELDVRVTLANDPKALQQEWAEDAVRLMGNDPVDVGRRAIYASDVRDFDKSPGFTLIGYRPDIRDVKISGDWAFEWGVFEAEFRETSGAPAKMTHGKLLRVLHREHTGDWKFARVMVVEDTPAAR